MLDLKAAAWEDGYAIVEEGGFLFTIRPPYRRENKHPMAVSEFATGVAKYGLSPVNGSFENWGALIEHLRRKFLEARKEPPNATRIKKLVERAPQDAVATYLDRIERELFPLRQWHAAAGILTHLLRNPVMKCDSDLLDRVSILLEKAEDGRAHDDFARVGLADTAPPLEEEFALVKRLYGPKALELGEQIRREGQVLRMGSPLAA
ncbi:hypothetical protein SBA6_80036 [Candidatus Sulfopaludibacter sp. SbA6]|nr:hypothetical protein SBA6_80036 [Candidatus Sulfopaludibacter sp. SbA6]